MLLLLFDWLHFIRNTGVSSLSSLIVSIDWVFKGYLLLEIAFIHASTYPTYELVLIIIDFVCITLLLISYVFLPNYIALDDENSKLLSNSNEKLNRNEDANLNEFSVNKQSLFSQIMFFYFEGYVFFGYKNKFNLDNILPLEHELKVDTVLNDYQTNYKDKYLKDSKLDNYNIFHLVTSLYRNFFYFNIFIFVLQILLSNLDPQILFYSSSIH